MSLWPKIASILAGVGSNFIVPGSGPLVGSLVGGGAGVADQQDQPQDPSVSGMPYFSPSAATNSGDTSSSNAMPMDAIGSLAGTSSGSDSYSGYPDVGEQPRPISTPSGSSVAPAGSSVSDLGSSKGIGGYVSAHPDIIPEALGVVGNFIGGQQANTLNKKAEEDRKMESLMSIFGNTIGRHA